MQAVIEASDGSYIFFIAGCPVSQKNSKKIGIHGRTGRPFVFSKLSVREWKRDACDQLSQQWGSRSPISGDLEAWVLVYLGPGQRIDADNMCAAPFDALEAAGIVQNDYQISKLHAERLRDPENPRIEITLKKRISS